MSGGSWEYEYARLEDLAQRLGDQRAAKRRALGRHISLIAKALHDIEWVDSGDYGPGDEVAAIDTVIKGTGLEKQVLCEDSKQLIKDLERLIK